MERRPRMTPLSRLNGAKPTKAAIARRSSWPSSGKETSRVLEVILPTPLKLRRSSSLARHAGEALRAAVISTSSLSISFSSQSMCALMRLRVGPCISARRFTSCTRIATSWRRRTSSSASLRVSSSGRRTISGSIACPKAAITWASMRSFLARRPVALAKSRICRGLTTATRNPAPTKAVATAVSYPPVASITTRSTGADFSLLAKASMPFPSLANCSNSPLGKTATSRMAFETSIPTTCLSLFTAPPRVPALRQCELGRSRNRSGLQRDPAERPCLTTGSLPMGVKTVYPAGVTVNKIPLVQHTRGEASGLCERGVGFESRKPPGASRHPPYQGGDGDRCPGWRRVFHGRLPQRRLPQAAAVGDARARLQLPLRHLRPSGVLALRLLRHRRVFDRHLPLPGASAL